MILEKIRNWAQYGPASNYLFQGYDEEFEEQTEQTIMDIQQDVTGDFGAEGRYMQDLFSLYRGNWGTMTSGLSDTIEDYYTPTYTGLESVGGGWSGKNLAVERAVDVGMEKLKQANIQDTISIEADMHARIAEAKNQIQQIVTNAGAAGATVDFDFEGGIFPQLDADVGAHNPYFYGTGNPLDANLSEGSWNYQGADVQTYNSSGEPCPEGQYANSSGVCFNNETEEHLYNAEQWYEETEQHWTNDAADCYVFNPGPPAGYVNICGGGSGGGGTTGGGTDPADLINFISPTNPNTNPCVVSTALNDTGEWSNMQKQTAVDWCQETHHDGSDRGKTWIRGYHAWGKVIAKLTKKSKIIRYLVKRGTDAFVEHTVKDNPNYIGWVVKNLWIDPLSYSIGYSRKNKVLGKIATFGLVGVALILMPVFVLVGLPHIIKKELG